MPMGEWGGGGGGGEVVLRNVITHCPRPDVYGDWKDWESEEEEREEENGESGGRRYWAPTSQHCAYSSRIFASFAPLCIVPLLSCRALLRAGQLH